MESEDVAVRADIAYREDIGTIQLYGLGANRSNLLKLTDYNIQRGIPRSRRMPRKEVGFIVVDKVIYIRHLQVLKGNTCWYLQWRRRWRRDVCVQYIL